ncbi:hypothetical protein D3C72_1349200 [compost metagenome]
MVEAPALDQHIRAAGSQRNILACEYQAGRAVPARGHVVQPQWFDDRALRQYVLHRDRLPVLRQRVHGSVEAVLDGHRGHLLARGAMLVHIACGVHGVP